MPFTPVDNEPVRLAYGTQDTAGGATSAEGHADAATLFQQQWQVYQLVLKHDVLEHKALYAALQQHLEADLKGPFHMLDLGCGDADYICRTLRASASAQPLLASYTGVDLSGMALDIARRNLGSAAPPDCSVLLLEEDMLTFARRAAAEAGTGAENGVCEQGLGEQRQPHGVVQGASLAADREPRTQHSIQQRQEGLQQRGNRYDVVLSSYAIHHLALEQKRELLGLVARLLRPGGCFLYLDVFLEEGEDRASYMRRYMADHDNWRFLNERQMQDNRHHVLSFDFPVHESTVMRWAQEAGYARTEVLQSRTFYRALLLQLGGGAQG